MNCLSCGHQSDLNGSFVVIVDAIYHNKINNKTNLTSKNNAPPQKRWGIDI